MTDRIFSRQFHGAEGAEAWRVLPDGAYAFFRTDSFSTSAQFVDAISGLVREGDAPDIDIRGDGVTVLLRAFKGTAGYSCARHRATDCLISLTISFGCCFCGPPRARPRQAAHSASWPPNL